MKKNDEKKKVVTKKKKVKKKVKEQERYFCPECGTDRESEHSNFCSVWYN